MLSRLREDSSGVASAVATLFALLVVLIFLQATIIQVVPQQQAEAEWQTSLQAQNAFAQFRSIAAGPLPVGAQFGAVIPLGTAATSPFAGASPGTLSFGYTGLDQANLSYSFVPHLYQSSVQKVEQDVVMSMDVSGSMAWNDPNNLRVTGAQEYVGNLQYPDEVAAVAFNSVACLLAQSVYQNCQGVAHNLSTDYSQTQSDLGLLAKSPYPGGNTNIGAALALGNQELVTHGNPQHAWIQILLTDGQNECGWSSSNTCGDQYTLNQATYAKAHNITIYTIGLSSSADATLLTDVATATGGAYYPAPTAASIRWIYFQISERYQASFQCGLYTSTESVSGSLALSLGSQWYPRQQYQMELGGVALNQSGSSAIQEGMPLTYQPMAGDTSSLSLTLVSFVGSPFQLTGTGSAFVEANVLSQQTQVVPVTTVTLGQVITGVQSMSTGLWNWASQGAMTAGAAANITVYLNQSMSMLQAGNLDASVGNWSGASNYVRQAEPDLSLASAQTKSEMLNGTMQIWLARSTMDQILGVGCSLTQWDNWYKGVTITINSPDAAAGWLQWLNETFQAQAANFDVGMVGETAIISIHGVSQFTVTSRVIELSATS